MWRVYYSGGLVVTGQTPDDWAAAPDFDVQVVVRFPQLDGLRWHSESGPVQDRDMWTGDDWFDPLGFGPKEGRLISDVEYRAIWETACADPSP